MTPCHARHGPVLQMFPKAAVYSIDETFLSLHDADRAVGDLVALGRRMREHVLQWTGIPTCVGFGPTKTLAKLANNIARPPSPSSVPTRRTWRRSATSAR